MPDPSILRLFVAIELPGSILSALTQLQHQLQRDPALARLRWVRPEGIHLTLKFLGETPASRRARIEEAITRGVQGAAPFDLRLGTLGTFGRKGQPRVAWVDVSGDSERLIRLQAAIDHELAAIGFQADSRPYSPHLTLARIPDDRAREVAEPLARAIGIVPPPVGEIPVEAVSLMRSELRPGGAVYTRLFTAPLR
jgi:2'-5' RNA ligase